VPVHRGQASKKAQAEMLSLSRDSISVADIHHAYYIVSGIELAATKAPLSRRDRGASEQAAP
jgi:hypothetical protein